MARTRAIGAAACIDDLRKASDGKLSDTELEEIVDALDRKRQALAAEGSIDNLDSRLAQAATEEANKVRLGAILAKKNAALTIIARDRTSSHVRSLMAGGLSPKKAVLAVFEGTVKGIQSARHSIYATKLAFERRYVGDMMAEVLRAVPGASRLTRDPEFARDIVREMFELREGGAPGPSGNPDAQKIAKVFAKHAEISRVDLNRLGANIGKLDDWGGPHAHDATKLLGVTDDDWVNRIAARLDLKRTFPDLDAEEARAVLKKSYLTIVTGKSDRLSAARKGQFQGPRNLARSLSKDRVLHFKSADDWLAYQVEFGHGNIWTGMLSHQRKMAGVAAQMQMLGPNPEILLASLLDQMAGDIKKDAGLSAKQKAKQIASLTLEGSSQIRQALSEATGVTSGVNPDGITYARIFSGYRATQSMAKLGGAVISSISDTVTQAANLKYQGRSLFASYHDQTVGMIKALARQTGQDEKQIAYLLGEGLDGMLDSIHASAFAEDSLPGAMTGAMSKFFRWSGLTGWTDNIRAVGARMMAAHMGDMAGKAWKTLPDQFKFVLNQHGIGEQHWPLIQAASFEGPNGKRYVTPDRISDLPDEMFAEFVPGVDSKIPAVKPGFVRLWHGGVNPTSGGGRWVSGHMDYAKGYAQHNSGNASEVHYVDVPRGESWLSLSDYFDEDGIIHNQEIPEAWAKKLKKLPEGAAPSASKLARAKLDAEIALSRFYSDEINFGVIETDARSRRFTLRGTQAGTGVGEGLRLLFQFKGWPIAYTQRVLGRALFGQRDGTSAVLHIGHLLAGTMVAGYLAMTAKDYLRGYDRRKFVNDDGGVNVKTLAASFAQGGGAGLYGDFLFANVSRFGSGIGESLAGPGIGAGVDLANNLMKARSGDIKAADWLTFALQNTPFVNLAYVRPATDYLIINSLRESISPGFLERQRSSRRADYGQSLLWPQTIGGTQ